MTELTNKIPTISRSKMSTVAFGENADNKALIRAQVDASRMTFFLPHLKSQENE